MDPVGCLVELYNFIIHTQITHYTTTISIELLRADNVEKVDIIVQQNSDNTL